METDFQPLRMRIFQKSFQAATLACLVALQSGHALFAAESSSGAVSETVKTGKRTFVVTAYYSPLPDQKRYLKGTYEADIRLNGNGTHGASGKPVYPGMLAAPKHYPFGTAIKLEGLGVGVVDDRGGAIVKAGERGQSHDRIDVWMGYGDEGLARALSWGRRTVQGDVIAIADAKIRPNVAVAGLPKAGLAVVSKPAKPAPPSVSDRIFSEPVGANSSTGMVRALSERLIAVGYLESAPSEAFNGDVKFALIRFQTDRGLLKGKNDSNAGYYGPATRKALKAAYETYLKDKKDADSDVEGMLATALSSAKAVSAESANLRKAVESMGTPKDGEVGSHIRSLQEMLVRLGYLDAKPTGTYGPKTKEAVAKFQIDAGLVSGFSDPNAGKFGKLTKSRFLLSMLEGAKK